MSFVGVVLFLWNLQFCHIVKRLLPRPPELSLVVEPLANATGGGNVGLSRSYAPGGRGWSSHLLESLANPDCRGLSFLPTACNGK